MQRFQISAIVSAIALTVLGASSEAATQRINLANCVNVLHSDGQPVGVSAGNAGAPLSSLRFNLRNPSAGNTIWLGYGGDSIHIQVSITGVTAVYALMNTYWGQGSIVNAVVTFKATGSTSKAFPLVGNTTIRDFNNYTWTNNINGTTTQPWWTNNLTPTPVDQTRRLDVHKFVLGPTFNGKRLTHMIVRAPANAGPNFLAPFVAAVNIDYSGTAGTPRCVRHSAAP